MSTFTLVRSAVLSSNMVSLTLESHEPLSPVQPGAFVHMAVGENRLRRPISVLDADEPKRLLMLGISPRGQGTQMLCALPEGSVIDMLGPMGHGFCPATDEVFLVGGGIGVAPLILAAKRFHATKAFFGFQTAAMAYGIEPAQNCGAQVSVATDDGTLGHHGYVTQLLEGELSQRKGGAMPTLLACGPTPMLAAVRKLALAYDAPAQLSMEERMACGVGACLVCACKTQGEGYARVCRDGPVFDAREVAL